MRLNRLLPLALALLGTVAAQPPAAPAPAASKPAQAAPVKADTAKPDTARPPETPVPVQAGPLKIIVLQGEAAKNNIRAKTAVAPAIEVRDDQEKPVPGAEVVFQLPATGPSGIFHGWMRTQTVKTNAQGQATVTGYQPNEEEGRFNIKVTATTRTQSGSAVIAQSNVRATGASATTKRSGWWKVVAIAGAGAIGGGIYAATRGDKTTATVTPTIPVVITSGPITVGTPR